MEAYESLISLAEKTGEASTRVIRQLLKLAISNLIAAPRADNCYHATRCQ